ncbi:hypothetical protein SAMN04490182_1466 [Pseudomonas cedrina]|uniref:Threonine synthase n=1 Tax=Pseudomonas cedrina TaxID=651740 RepID=A0ABY0UBQ3_PSECE|nr:hypothetical protein SAMN04490182_1466 [Pseudomonas cedrina]
MIGYISVSSVTATYGSALTAGHFWKDPKVTKRSSPHHSAPRLGSVCPNEGLNPWAAAMGHPWPSAANPASCRVTHGFKPAFGQRGFTGRLRSKAKAERGGLRADRYLTVELGQMWELACLRRHQLGMPDSPGRPHRRQASSHRKAICGTQKNAFDLHHSSRLSGRFAFAFDLDFDLRRPVKHAGRNSTGIWGVNRQGCRFSRPAPWMARGGGPPNPCRITGTPSLGEVPSVGARALCLLWGFSKVSRRKGGTKISRYRSNGYVHLQKGPTP